MPAGVYKLTFNMQRVMRLEKDELAEEG